MCTAVASAANSDELTDRQLEAQMKAFQAQTAKLQKQLAARDRRAPAASPEMVTMDGNLTFKVKDGKRIGYQLGDGDVVHFDELQKTDQTLGLLIQTAVATGAAEQKAEKTSVDLLVELNKNNIELVKNNKDNNAAMVKEFKVFNAAFVAAQLAAANATQAAAVFQVQAAKQAAASGSKIYWFDNHVDAGETAAKTYVNPSSRPYIKLTGVGFEPRFHPHASGQFECEFAIKGKKDAVSTATIKSEVDSAGSYYHVECQVPAYNKGTVVTMKLFELDGAEIPFRGGKGGDSYEVQPLYTATNLISRYPSKPDYEVTGSWNVGTRYTCTWRGDLGKKFARAVTAKSTTKLECGKGPTSQISNIDGKTGAGKAELIISIGSTVVKSRASARNVEYFICSSGSGVVDCLSGCATGEGGNQPKGQANFLTSGSFSWYSPFCGYVSVAAVGGGSGGGYQWSSGGGGGGGLGYIKRFQVKKDQKYTVVVGKSGACTSNAGNSHSSDGGTSYFVNTNTVAGYGAGKGGPNSESGGPGYGGGYKGDGGGRGGRGGRGTWHGGGGGAGGYKGRGGDVHYWCHHNNRRCDAPSGSGGGGGGGYYSSTWGTPAGGGVGIYGAVGGDGRGDWQQGSTGGSGGTQGRGGEGARGSGGNNNKCGIEGGKFGGGGGGSGSAGHVAGGKGGHGAVRIVWGPQRAYPMPAPDV